MRWYAEYAEAYVDMIHRRWFDSFEDACAFASKFSSKLPDGRDRVVKVNMLGRAAKDIMFVNGVRK